MKAKIILILNIYLEIKTDFRNRYEIVYKDIVL